MIRLFAAIPIPEDIRSRLYDLRGGVSGAKWVARENYHLSLRFIGEVDQGVARDIDAALFRVRAPAFSVELSGVGYFGKGAKARILWAGVAACDALGHLQSKIEVALMGAGLTEEHRKYAPHVTMARLKRPDGARLDAYVGNHAGFHTGPIPVDRFVLYSSFLSRSGAIYTPEAEYGLSDAA
ncbi:MAG: RNA 2',3'-cyclic phosphodiesterase [Rhodospirillaceae bacterium]|jgi:RNA 2',3'-cyclic 3'-phosphodiesterase|nr:RNA 2',3'-cyclic phosphodiesterase [Rhodospirillaceae bacterium]MBT5665326.1 RNA 2',3'-cyclic phosphodiesterase [Rhodospirillaceae bacterium]